VLVSILAPLALGAWFTDLTGIYAVFGAFLLGAAVPRGLLTEQLQRMVEPLTTALLLPMFFVFSGLNSQLSLVNSGWLWFVAGVTLVAACVGKAVGCGVAAKLSGAPSREAIAVGVLMNARGLMELILLNIGLQRGLITPTLFTILVLMAIAATLIAGPLFAIVWRSHPGTVHHSAPASTAAA
jgi:Kef-type K+ transport system membrane component KefB